MKDFSIRIEFDKGEYDTNIVEAMLGFRPRFINKINKYVVNNAILDETQLVEEQRDGDGNITVAGVTAQDLADGIMATYASVLATKQAEAAISAAIEKAMDYGKIMIRDYGTRNVLAGKTDEQIDANLTELSGILSALTSGSLKSAKRQGEAFVATDNVSQEDIDWFLNRINEYLGS
jgi:hypothetical protein